MKVRPEHSNFNNPTSLPLWDAARRAELRGAATGGKATGHPSPLGQCRRNPDRGARRPR